MSENIELSDLWEHTITKTFKHDPESELGIKIREWVIYNKLENFNSILKYLSYMNEHGDILPYTPMKNIQLKMVHTTSHG